MIVVHGPLRARAAYHDHETPAIITLPGLAKVKYEVVELLEERARRLEIELAQAHATRELVEKQGSPRLFWVEAELRMLLRETELAYVRTLAQDIESGTLDGS